MYCPSSINSCCVMEYIIKIYKNLGWIQRRKDCKQRWDYTQTISVD